MSRKRDILQPIVVNGVARPDLDHRLVPGRLMAIYLGVGPVTLWRWTIQGKFGRDCYQTSGEKRPNYYYRPNRICTTPLETSAGGTEQHQPPAPE